MMFKRTLLSTVSIAAIAFSAAAPALAYVFPGGGAISPTPTSVPGITYPSILGFPYQPGSYVRHDRAATSRDVYRHARRLNAPRVGYIRQFGGERGIPEPDYTGRSLLPLRSYVRYQQETLRSYGRGILGRQRGPAVGEYGDYRILNRRGDIRRRPVGFPQLYPYPAGMTSVEPQAYLPPTLVQTGRSTILANEMKPTRRGIVNIAEIVNPPVVQYF